MSNKYCIICNHGSDRDDDPSILKIREGLTSNSKDPCFICELCDTFFQPNSYEINNRIIDLVNNTEIHRVFLACLRFARLITLNAPKSVLANEVRMMTARSVSKTGLDLFEEIKNMWFDRKNYPHPTFTDSQTVDLITAAELSLRKK